MGTSLEKKLWHLWSHVWLGNMVRESPTASDKNNNLNEFRQDPADADDGDDECLKVSRRYK